jgi:hypothetical protein
VLSSSPEPSSVTSTDSESSSKAPDSSSPSDAIELTGTPVIVKTSIVKNVVNLLSNSIKFP